MIDRSLMRPRGLLELLRFCRSRAVNLGHERIEATDIVEGEKAYASELLNNIMFEIRDVFPTGAEVLYEFLESPVEFQGNTVRQILTQAVGDDQWQRMLDVLLWYGFLGVVREDQEVTYIYDVTYDMRRLMGLIRRRGDDQVRFRINPAFWQALEVRV